MGNEQAKSSKYLPMTPPKFNTLPQNDAWNINKNPFWVLRACKGRAANLRACVYLRIWCRKAIPPKSFQSLPYGQQPLNKVANFFPSWCFGQSHWIILNSRSKSNYIIVIMEQIWNDHLHYSFLIDPMIAWPFPWIGFFHHFCRVSTPVILIRPWVKSG